MSASGQSRSLFVVQRTFSRVRRGYDPDEVDRHLQLASEWFVGGRIGEMAREIEAGLDARERALAEREEDVRKSIDGAAVEAQATLEGARLKATADLRAAERTLQEAQESAEHRGREADALLERARDEARALVEQAREQSAAIVDQARQEAAAAEVLREAREQAQRIVADAESEAQRSARTRSRVVSRSSRRHGPPPSSCWRRCAPRPPRRSAPCAARPSGSCAVTSSAGTARPTGSSRPRAASGAGRAPSRTTDHVRANAVRPSRSLADRIPSQHAGVASPLRAAAPARLAAQRDPLLADHLLGPRGRAPLRAQLGRAASEWATTRRDIWSKGPAVLAAMESHLTSPRVLRRARVLWTPSWGTPCGLAEYTRDLAAALERGHAVPAATMPDLRAARLLHVQHEPSLFRDADLARVVDAARVERVSVVVTEHAVTPEPRAWEADVSALVAHSAGGVETLRARCPGRRVEHIPHGCHTWFPPRKPDRGRVLGVFGFLERHKGVREVLEAVRALGDIELRMHSHPKRAGDGCEWEALMAGLPVRWDREYRAIKEIARRLAAETDVLVFWYQDVGVLSASGAVRVGPGDGRPGTHLTDSVVRRRESCHASAGRPPGRDRPAARGHRAPRRAHGRCPGLLPREPLGGRCGPARRALALTGVTAPRRSAARAWWC
jgi:DivIVA domain-containing protein